MLTNVTHQLLDISTSSHPLYGADLVDITDVMDDVVSRMDMVDIDANSSAAFNELFEASVNVT